VRRARCQYHAFSYNPVSTSASSRSSTSTELRRRRRGHRARTATIYPRERGRRRVQGLHRSQRSVRFSAAPPVDDDEGWTKCLGKTARGRAKRSAECGTSVPSIRSAIRAAVPSLRSAVCPSTRSSVRPSAGITSLDAVAPPVTPSVPSAAVPLPPWEGFSYDKNGTLTPPSVRAVPSAVAPSFTPSVALPAPPGGVTPGNAASPVVYSVSPATIPQAAPTNDLPIPVGATAASTNEFTSKINDPKSISADESTSKISDPELIPRFPLRRASLPSRFSVPFSTPRMRPSIVPSNLVLSQMQLLGLRPSLLIIPYLPATPLPTPLSWPRRSRGQRRGSARRRRRILPQMTGLMPRLC